MSDTRARVLSLLIVFLLAWLLWPVPTPKQSRIQCDPAKLQNAAALMRALSRELDRAANEGQENMDEYLVLRAQEIFDEKVKVADLPGPDIVSRPVARLLVRPIVMGLIQAATEGTEQ